MTLSFLIPSYSFLSFLIPSYPFLSNLFLYYPTLSFLFLLILFILPCPFLPFNFYVFSYFFCHFLIRPYPFIFLHLLSIRLYSFYPTTTWNLFKADRFISCWLLSPSLKWLLVNSLKCLLFFTFFKLLKTRVQ